MSLAKNTAITSLSGVMAVGSGVVLDGIIVAAFGLGRETDAYFIASLLPLAAITILHLQAGKVIQPLFIHALNHDGPVEAARFLSLAVTAVTAFLALVGVLCLPVVPHLIALQAPGSSADTKVLATEICALMLLVPAIYAPIVLMKEALIGVGRFGLPGSLKTIENVFKILFVLVFIRKLGVFALPVGMVAGAVVQAALVYAALRREGIVCKPNFHWRDGKLKKSLQLAAFPMVGHVSSTAVDMVQNILASLAGAGAVSALRLATRIVDAFAGLLANSIVIAVMPMVTRSLANSDPQQMKANIRQAMRLLLLLAVPASAWLLMTHRPLIALLFERMRFSADDTALVSSILVLMIPYILLSRIFGLAETGFYGACDTRTPLKGAMALTGIYLCLMLALFPVFEIYALPLARSAAYLCGGVLMLWLFHRRFGSLELASLRGTLVRIAAATAVMLLCIHFGQLLATSLGFHGLLSKVVNLAFPTSLGLLGLTISAAWLRIVDVRTIRDRLFPKIALVAVSDAGPK